MPPNRYTVDDIMELGPCSRYPRTRVEELWAGRDSLALSDILALEIPPDDRIWAVVGLLEDRIGKLMEKTNEVSDAAE